MPPIDPTEPEDDDTLQSFPGGERAHRTVVKNLIEAEHDGTTGRHKIPVVADAAARNALFPTPANGNLCYRRDTDQLELYDSGVPGWVNVQSPSGHDFGLLNGTLIYVTASTVRIDRATGGVLQVEIDGVVITASSSVTWDIASHLDIGVEAASTFYYLYLQNVAGVLTPKVSATAPMPTGGAKVGYHPTNTTWRYIACVYNNAASNFVPFYAHQYAPGRFEIVVRDFGIGTVSPAESVDEHSTVQDADVSPFLPTTARAALVHAEAFITNTTIHMYDSGMIGAAITSTSPGPFSPYNTLSRTVSAWLTHTAWLGLTGTRHIGYSRTRVEVGSVPNYGSHKFTVFGWRDY